MTTPEPRWPLEGVKVLDLGQIYNGPYAGFLLAHAGADVVKVEPLQGEVLRQRGGGSVPLSFAMLNTNKRGLAIDLKHADGKALLLELVRQADVLLENFAPGAMERLGLGAETLMAANPRLVYASGTGYGLSGPARDNLAMDLTVQAVGGVMSVNGPADGPPLKTGPAICDFVGGVHLYGGIMTALFERSVTGRGRVVEVAMQEAIYPVLTSNIASLHRNGWQQPPRRGNQHPTRGSAPYNVYSTTDGHIAIICVQEAHWQNLLEVIGRADLKDDPRFASQALRAEHEAVIDAIVEAWTSGLGKSEAAEMLRSNRVPAAPVRDLVEVTSDAHMHERGMLQDIHHPTMGDVVLPTSPLRFHGSPDPSIRLEPDVGGDTDTVLADWLGLDADGVSALRRAGAIRA
ncbi:MAG: CoA transferase [Proteobacteria bacterium]|nr:CoA transferase [Pseudomonadota bacterium]